MKRFAAVLTLVGATLGLGLAAPAAMADAGACVHVHINVNGTEQAIDQCAP